MRLHHKWGLWVLISLSALLPPEAEAQSVMTGTVSGTVRGGDSRPVAQGLVTLAAAGGGSTYDVTTTGTGTFTIPLVQPGSYEIRVEAVGHRPLVARGLTIGGGETRSVSLTLTPEPPPVTRVDTISLGSSSASRVRAGTVQLGSTEVRSWPHRFGDLASVVGLSTSFDAGLGSQGLPGDMTLIVADGVPFYGAAHPAARRELLTAPLFPVSALAGVSATHDAGDIEWAGAAGGYVGVTTRSGASTQPVELEGSYSGSPVWSSGELEGDVPSLLSWHGGARGAVQLSRRGRLFATGEVLQQQTPAAARAPESLAAALSGLDPSVLAALTEPSLEDYDRYSGLVRFDLAQSPTSSGFLRVAGGFARREFDGPGPSTLTGLATPEEESLDLSAAVGIVNHYARTSTFELRAGFSRSSREFDHAEGTAIPAYVTGAGAALGAAAGSGGSVSRTDFLATPVFHWTPGDRSALKFGATARASRHTSTYSRAQGGSLYFGDAMGVLDGRGFGVVTSAPEVTFSVQEYGLFVQGEAEIAPGVEIRIAGRYDYEAISGDGPTSNAEWLATTGLDNTDFPDRHHQVGVRGVLSWDPFRDGRTRVSGMASTHVGDVDLRALSETFSGGTEVTSTRWAGAGLSWPDGGLPPQATALPSPTLLGPDLRAPSTIRADIDVVQRLSAGTSFFARGSTRRTDFLVRRRNLNLPVLPQATDPNGRSIYGTLQQDGPLVTTTDDDARRFPSFGDVYALDPDGWSEYRGVTLGVEHVGPLVELFGAYTLSRTEDNWIGAGSGAVGSTLPPGLPMDEGDSWDERTSDFDVPHRVAAGMTIDRAPIAVSAVYRFRSGFPFTPGYRLGVDANGDGSGHNDVAFVPDAAELGELVDEWPCLEDQAGGFARRNSCRGPSVHTVDARIRVELGRVGGLDAALTVDGLNLIEGKDGVIDGALLLVDPEGAITESPDGSTVTIPTVVNDRFGSVLYPGSRGRMLRIALRIGG